MRLITALIFAVFSCCATAQTVSEEMRKDILELLGLSGSLKLGEQISAAASAQMLNALRTQRPDLPQRAFDIVQETINEHMSGFVNDPANVDYFVNLYARHFTHEEIKQVVAFYKTPTGAKMLQALPTLSAESVQFVQGKMQALVPTLQQDIARRLQAEGLVPAPGQAPAPAPTPPPAQ